MKMPESVVNLKVEIVVSQLYQVGVATSYDVAQGNFDELITVYTIFIRIATPLASLSPFFQYHSYYYRINKLERNLWNL